MAAQPAEHPAVQVFDTIRHIDSEVRAAITEALASDLTFPQYEVLDHLDRRGDGVTPAEIARAVHAAKSGLTNTLQRLEESGLIRVEPCAEDGRKKRVSLTPAGRSAYMRTLAGLRPKMEHLREAITLDEFRKVLPFLKALRAWFDEKAWQEAV